MCVKEFLGYNCGHCSVPSVKQCPLSASNPIFPICQFPAERPIFVNEHCHPCSRVVWNAKVLREEEEHKKRHHTGDCRCEVIFDQEERERRLRSRLNKGKGKIAEDNMVGGLNGDEQCKSADSKFDVDLEQARLAAYRYVGYPASSSQLQPYLQQQEFDEQFNVGQPIGMKWHPWVHFPALPAPELRESETGAGGEAYLGRSSSAPAEIRGHDEVTERGEESVGAQQPMVMKSEAAQPKST